jgi:hypothetical protein
MKRLAVLICVMALLLVPAAVGAQLPGSPLPEGAVEVEHWEFREGNWVHFPDGSLDSLARAFRSGGAIGSCNRAVWTADFTNHAAVAQWSSWSITGNRWDWRVLKPGEYAADCIGFWLQSNEAVAIDFEGFGDLTRITPGGVKQTIDTYYGYGDSINTAAANGWTRAADLNTLDLTIPDTAALHAGSTVKLLNRIVVDVWNSAGEYEDTAVVTLSLVNQQPWVTAAGSWVTP